MCYISFRSTYEIKMGKRAVMAENGRTGHGGNEKESRTKAKRWNNVSLFVSWYVFIFYVYFILLLIITSRLIETMTRKFQPPPLSTTTTTMRTYGLVRVTIGCSGIGEETRIKGPNDETLFHRLCLRYIYIFFLNLDMFVCTYMLHMSSSFYWSYHSYQLFHCLT